MKKVVFLDRDGTINVDKNYLYQIEEFEYVEGAIEGMRKLCEAGYILIVITNQSGIARGFYREQDFIRLNNWMIEDLKRKGVTITDTFYCPHLEEGRIEKYNKECDCRKPKTGLFWKAIRKYEIDLENSYAIGDKIRDLAICLESKVQGILLCENIIDNRNDFNVKKNLFEAAEYIVERDNNAKCY